MFKVEKNVPVPAQTIRAKYPFALMEPSDSFVVPNGRAKQVRSAASNHAKRFGGKFKTRTLPGGDLRIWRKA